MKNIARPLLLACLLATAGCNAFGDLTTGAMTTTNRVAGQPPAGPNH